jgi:hypothetical protein
MNHIQKPSATAGHLPPQTVNAAASGTIPSAGWVKGDKLQGKSILAVCSTGAFVGTTPSCAFKLQAATDANGTSAADVTNGAFATIAAANTVSEGQLSTDLIDPAKYYAVNCAVTGGTSAIVAAQIRVLDPKYVS